MLHRQRSVLLFLAMVELSSCATVKVSARLSFDGSLSASPERESRLLGEPMLKSDAALVFLPPSQCSDLAGAPLSATSETILLRNDCGVLMSELEREAAASGFKVVSWQAVRPPVTGTAYDLARGLKVDAVVEVDQLSLTQLSPDSEAKYRVDVFNSKGDLVVPDIQEVATRCKENYPLDKKLSTTKVLSSASASVKLVSAADSSVRWTYRRTLPGAQGLRLQETHDFAGSGTGSHLIWGLSGVGLISGGLAYGGSFGPFGGGSGTVIAVAGVLAGLGIIVGSIIATVNSAPEPADIVCWPGRETSTVTDVLSSVRAERGSSYTFYSNRPADQDSQEAERRRLLRTIARDVVKDLRQAQKLAPPGPSQTPGAPAITGGQ